MSPVEVLKARTEAVALRVEGCRVFAMTPKEKGGAGAEYEITAAGTGLKCECPAFKWSSTSAKERTCKHCRAALEREIWLQMED